MCATLRSWLPKKPIEAIVFYDHTFMDADQHKWGFVPFRQVLPIDDSRVQQTLDVEFDSGYGNQDCPQMYVWTADEVHYVHEYDGATWLSSVPRNPRDCIEAPQTKE